MQKTPPDGHLEHGQVCYLYMFLRAPVTQGALITGSEEFPLVVK